MAVTINTLREFKQKGEAFAALTSYDATFSQVVSEAGVHVILIGDSLGMVLQGHDSTLPVTMDQMVYHVSVGTVEPDAYMAALTIEEHYETSVWLIEWQYLQIDRMTLERGDGTLVRLCNVFNVDGLRMAGAAIHPASQPMQTWPTNGN